MTGQNRDSIESIDDEHCIDIVQMCVVNIKLLLWFQLSLQGSNIITRFPGLGAEDKKVRKINGSAIIFILDGW